MGFAARLSEEHDGNPAWKDLQLTYVINQDPASLESGSLEHLKDNTFGVGADRAAGEAKRTVILDKSKAFNGYLGTEEFTVFGQLLRLLSGYWLPMVFRSLLAYKPRNFLTAFIDVRIGSAVWRGRTPGGLVLTDPGGSVVLKHFETQPGDHVDWEKLTAAVELLK